MLFNTIWIRFLIYTFLLTWVVGIVMIIPLLGVEQLFNLPENSISNLVAKYGPSLGGLLTVYTFFGHEGMRDLLKRALKWRVGISGYLWAILIPMLTKVPLVWLAVQPLQINPIGPEVLSAMCLAFLTHLFLGGGFGEELGWRGVMLPHLSTKYHLLKSSMIVAFFWTIWHLPAYLLDDKGESEPLLAFLIAVIALSIILTWLYFHAQQSVLIVAIFHATINASGKIMAASTSVELDFMQTAQFFWMETLVLVVIALLLLLFNWKNFKRKPYLLSEGSTT